MRVLYRVEQVASGPVETLDAVRLRRFLAPPPARRPVPEGQREVGREDADRLAAWPARQLKGDRNYKLFWAACRLAEGNVPVSAALDALARAEQPDFGEREITRTVYSAYRSVGTGTNRRERAAVAPSDGTAVEFDRHAAQRQAPVSRGLT